MNGNNVLFSSENEVEVIGGHMYNIPYEVFLQDGTAADLRIPGLIIEWRLAPFGYKNMPLIVKTNATSEIELDATNRNEFVVHVLKEDTANLDGVYTSQLTIIDPSGNVSRPYEGQTIVRSAIES